VERCIENGASTGADILPHGADEEARRLSEYFDPPPWLDRPGVVSRAPGNRPAAMAPISPVQEGAHRAGAYPSPHAGQAGGGLAQKVSRAEEPPMSLRNIDLSQA
jgi:hypothetical protein